MLGPGHLLSQARVTVCRQRYGLRLAYQSRTLLTKAFVRGPTEPPLLDLTTADHFRSVAKQYGDRTAYVAFYSHLQLFDLFLCAADVDQKPFSAHSVISRHQNKTLTYHQLNHDSDQLAKGLKSLGVRKGDRCCVSLGNNIEFATVRRQYIQARDPPLTLCS
jgi:hypothetical protein